MTRRPLPESYWSELAAVYSSAEGSTTEAVGRWLAARRGREVSQVSALQAVAACRRKGFLPPAMNNQGTAGPRRVAVQRLAEALGVDRMVLMRAANAAEVQIHTARRRSRKAR